MLRYELVLLAAFISWTMGAQVATGDTVCKDGGLDWYTSKVGETPCTFRLRFIMCLLLTAALVGRTYELLRQVCNSVCEWKLL